MKLALIKILISFALLTSTYEAQAYFKVELLNLTGQTILYSHSFESNSGIHLAGNYNLENNKKTDICKDEEVTLEGNKIVFIDTSIPCAWIKFWGINYAHGWGLTIKLNGKEAGTICANKKMMLDPLTHSRLEFYKDDKEYSYVKFSNVGWWEDGSKFPISVTLKLE